MSLQKPLLLSYLLCCKYFQYDFENFILSKVIFSNSNVLEDFIVFPTTGISFSILFFWLRTYIEIFWDFHHLNIIESIYCYISIHFQLFWNDIWIPSTFVYKVVPSTKLKTSVCLLQKAIKNHSKPPKLVSQSLFKKLQLKPIIMFLVFH